MARSRPKFSRVIESFEASATRGFSRSDLVSSFESNRLDWGLPSRMSAAAFLERLLQETKMSEVTLKCTRYDDLIRYAWGADTPPIHLALSIKRGAYCSHATAMYAHGLGGDANTLFINNEQSEKPAFDSELTQEAIDRAFRNKQRTSRLVYRYRDAKITVLSGKHTDRLGVERLKMPSGEEVEATSLERTLVDISVRPIYAGGVPAVLEAFRRARGRISTDTLLRVLKKLKHAYPYHQAIGFYMRRGGYPEGDQRRLKALGIPFHFYLGHGLKPLEFDPEFKIYFPMSLNSSDSRRQQ